MNIEETIRECEMGIREAASGPHEAAWERVADELGQMDTSAFALLGAAGMPQWVRANTDVEMTDEECERMCQVIDSVIYSLEDLSDAGR